MSVAAKGWQIGLWLAAPAMPMALTMPLAQLLAGPADTDMLLIVGDALEEAAAEHLLFGDTLIATQMQRLAAVVRDEARRRA